MPLELPVTTATFASCIGSRRIPHIAAQWPNGAFQGQAIAKPLWIREDRRLLSVAVLSQGRLGGLKSASPQPNTTSLSARLKPCPDTKLTNQISQQLMKSCPNQSSKS